MSATAAPPAVPGWPFVERLDTVDVVLARPRVADAEAVFALQSDARLYVDVPPAWRVQSVAMQADELRRHVAHWHQYGFGYWLVWPAGTDPASPGEGVRPLGMAGVRWMWWRGEWVLNVFVRFAVAAQGRGLATAVLWRALARLDGVLARPTHVVVRTRGGNAAMVALAERLGLVDTGHEEREMGTYRVLERLVGGPDRPAGSPPDVRVRATGPWVVQPHVPVRHRTYRSGGVWSGRARAVPVDPRHRDVALCRCGRTTTPPTCDRSHVDVAVADLPCTVLDDAVVAAAATCPPGSVRVVGPAGPVGADAGHADGDANEDVDDDAAGLATGATNPNMVGGEDDAAVGTAIVIGAGVCVRLLDDRTVRAPVAVVACRCGTHIIVVEPA